MPTGPRSAKVSTTAARRCPRHSGKTLRLSAIIKKRRWRCPLNVLLSFAQFEREVTGERIRDKIAASKRKGIWMGGVVPLGYRVENRALHVVEEHATFVRDLYWRHLEIGSVVRLKAILDHEDARLPLRTDGTGKTIGGGLISRGHLYKILSNPIYLGRLTHKGQAHDGLHDPIGWNQGDYECRRKR